MMRVRSFWSIIGATAGRHLLGTQLADSTSTPLPSSVSRSGGTTLFCAAFARIVGATLSFTRSTHTLKTPSASRSTFVSPIDIRGISSAWNSVNAMLRWHSSSFMNRGGTRPKVFLNVPPISTSPYCGCVNGFHSVSWSPNSR